MSSIPFKSSMSGRSLMLAFAAALFLQLARGQSFYQLYGVNFSPYEGNQSPGTPISPAQIQQMLQVVAPHTIWVRTYSSLNGLDQVCPMAHVMGLKCAAGASIYGSSTDGQELSALIVSARTGNVDLAIIGTEALFRGNVSAAALASYIQQFRNAVPGVPVTTADTYQALLDNATTIIPAVDMVLFDIYPFYEGISIDHAISYVNGWYQLMQSAAGTKPVIIAETGWPSAGQSIGKAVPSSANATAYFLDFVSWARAQNTSYFYFEAFDEPWKIAENSQGPFFGIWDAAQNLKPGNQAVFSGETLPDNWSGNNLPGGASNPQVLLTYVPPYGASSTRVYGQALHVRPADYKIACYIESTAGTWYVKPTYSRPLTPIFEDGTWSCQSELNVAFAAFLVPNGSIPPGNLYGDPSAPPPGSVASAELHRSQYSISGTVSDNSGNGLDHLTVSLTGSASETTQTANGGQYSFVNLSSGGNYTVTVRATGTTFQPPSETFPSLNTAATVNFVASSEPPVALRFVPLTPCRLADTRNTPGPRGGPAPGGGSTREFVVPMIGCNVPAGALAYALNVTVVPHGSLGYLTIWGTGQQQPFVSTLNSPDGRVKANAAIVPAGRDGEVSVYVTDASDVVLDINGYFVPAGSSGGLELAFFPLTPCRVSDTRMPAGPFGGPTMGAGETRTIPISNACSIPPGAQAYSLNFTLVPHEPLSYLTAWAAGQSQPFVSTLNAPTGAVTANAAVIPAGNSGSIDVFSTNMTELIIDINGYFGPAATGGLSLYTLPPCRIVDTRNPPGPFGSPSLSGGSARTWSLPNSSCAVPSSAMAYSLNATVVPSAISGYLTMWAADAVQPFVSTLDWPDLNIMSNAAIVPAGSSGGITTFASASADLVLDVNGYFAP